MLKVGITGGIGSGKSIVCQVFSTLGIPVYDADKVARQLIDSHPEIQKKIIEIFGQTSYRNEGLNRSYIASIVFNDKNKLAQLNAITHPVVIAHSKTWMENQVAAYAIKEAALLFESDSYKELDFIIGVAAPLDLRIARVMHRDGLKKEAILDRMKNQMDEKEKMDRCDFIIYNDEQKPILPQVMKVHHKLSK